MILHPQNPRVGIVTDDVVITFDGGTRLLLSTPAEVDRLVDELGKARTLLEQQQTARSERARLLGTASTASTHVRVFRPEDAA